MNTAVALLVLLNLALIGALPRIFFRPGRLTPGWWITAAPFALTAAAVVAGLTGSLHPVAGHAALDAIAAFLSAASVGLIGLTLGSHERPLSLWHQSDDWTTHLVMHGAYRRIRHPFYSAFQMTLAAAAMLFPHPVTLGALIYGVLRLRTTAIREERVIGASEFGAEYRAYMDRTRRFWPGFRSARSLTRP